MDWRQQICGIQCFLQLEKFYITAVIKAVWKKEIITDARKRFRHSDAGPAPSLFTRFEQFQMSMFWMILMGSHLYDYC